MFEEMQSYVHEAKVITDYATISACSKATQGPLAVGLFEEMQSHVHERM